jgi:hypothetical protein
MLCMLTGPPLRATEVPPATGTRTVASMEGAGTAHREPFRLSSNIKTEEEPALVPAGAREASTAPDPVTGTATGPDTAAAVGRTATVPEMAPDTAAAAALTEPEASGFPETLAETWEVVGGGGGRGLGGRHHHPEPRPAK